MTQLLTLGRTDHVWTGPRPPIRYVHCAVCGIIKNIGKPNGPCKGAVKVVLREPLYECNAAECGWRGPKSKLVHPKHDSTLLLCPDCHETVDPL